MAAGIVKKGAEAARVEGRGGRPARGNDQPRDHPEDRKLEATNGSGKHRERNGTEGDLSED